MAQLGVGDWYDARADVGCHAQVPYLEPEFGGEGGEEGEELGRAGMCSFFEIGTPG